MNDVVREWIEKADGDFRTAGREAAAAEGPNHDAVCFHAQQCVEKLMKAVLIDLGAAPPRTHDLNVLDGLIRGVAPSWNCPPEDLRFLTQAAVHFRYPGESADADDAREAMELCVRLRSALKALLR